MICSNSGTELVERGVERNKLWGIKWIVRQWNGMNGTVSGMEWDLNSVMVVELNQLKEQWNGMTFEVAGSKEL